MNSRDPFPDEELRRRIMDFIMAAGQTLLENGAEVFRVEQTMEIMARSFHLREFHVYVLTNGIFASAGTAEISEVRNVPVRTTHLGRVAAVNELSRQIAQTGMTLDEAESRLVLARQLPFPKDHVQLLSYDVHGIIEVADALDIVPQGQKRDQSQRKHRQVAHHRGRDRALKQRRAHQPHAERRQRRQQ